MNATSARNRTRGSYFGENTSTRITLSDLVIRRHQGSMTWQEWVWWAGRERDLLLSDAEINDILWEHTAWPIAGTAYVQDQVRTFLRGH